MGQLSSENGWLKEKFILARTRGLFGEGDLLNEKAHAHGENNVLRNGWNYCLITWPPPHLIRSDVHIPRQRWGDIYSFKRRSLTSYPIDYRTRTLFDREAYPVTHVISSKSEIFSTIVVLLCSAFVLLALYLLWCCFVLFYYAAYRYLILVHEKGKSSVLRLKESM